MPLINKNAEDVAVGDRVDMLKVHALAVEEWGDDWQLTDANLIRYEFELFEVMETGETADGYRYILSTEDDVIVIPPNMPVAVRV